MKVPLIDESVERAELLREIVRLRERLAVAERKLAERGLVERAKGMLMKSHGLDEEGAYCMLRKLAMDRKLRIGEVAQRVIDGA